MNSKQSCQYLHIFLDLGAFELFDSLFENLESDVDNMGWSHWDNINSKQTVSFFIFWSLRWHNLLNCWSDFISSFICQSLFKEIQIVKVIYFWDLTLRLKNDLDIVQISKNSLCWLSFCNHFNIFNDKSCALLKQNCIISFKSWVRCIILQQVWKSRESTKTCTATRFSNLVYAFISHLSENSIEYLW